jgi:hypothetical protein
VSDPVREDAEYVVIVRHGVAELLLSQDGRLQDPGVAVNRATLPFRDENGRGEGRPAAEDGAGGPRDEAPPSAGRQTQASAGPPRSGGARAGEAA